MNEQNKSKKKRINKSKKNKDSIARGGCNQAPEVASVVNVTIRGLTDNHTGTNGGPGTASYAREGSQNLGGGGRLRRPWCCPRK